VPWIVTRLVPGSPGVPAAAYSVGPSAEDGELGEGLDVGGVRRPPGQATHVRQDTDAVGHGRAVVEGVGQGTHLAADEAVSHGPDLDRLAAATHRRLEGAHRLRVGSGDDRLRAAQRSRDQRGTGDDQVRVVAHEDPVLPAGRLPLVPVDQDPSARPDGGELGRDREGRSPAAEQPHLVGGPHEPVVVAPWNMGRAAVEEPRLGDGVERRRVVARHPALERGHRTSR